jgi:Potential Queuosine, Q, salvage protein family
VSSLATHLIPFATDVTSSAIYTRPPIRFENLCEELDYMCLASLLDFGSGYDPLLKATENKPAASSHTSLHEAAEFAVLGMAMQDSLPDAATLVDYPRYEVSGAYNIDATEEKEVMPGVTMTSPGPLTPVLASIQEVLNETGRSLLDNGNSSHGAYVLRVVEERERAGQAPSAAYLVEHIVENLKFGFKDCYETGAEESKEEVVFHRKAQQLVGRLYLRFAKSDPRFDFQDIDELTMDSGEVMIAVLVQKGVLQLSPELEAKVEAGEDLKDSREVVAMRAAAVEAGRRICEEAKKDIYGAEVAAGGEGNVAANFFTSRHLSAYLLRQAEVDEELKDSLKFHINTATVAY